MDENELAYNARFKGDCEFGAKLLGAIDLAFFNLCDTCFRASSIDEVDFGKVCLSNLRDDILCNQFHEGMPTYLITANNSKRELEESGVKEGGKVTKKLKDGKDTKDKYKDLGEMVKIIKQIRIGSYQEQNIKLYSLKMLIVAHLHSMTQV